MSLAPDDDGEFIDVAAYLFTLVYIIAAVAIEIWLIYQGIIGDMELWKALVVAASILVLSPFIYVILFIAVMLAVLGVAITLLFFDELFGLK